MGVVLLLALGTALLVYGLLSNSKHFSARSQLVTHLGPKPLPGAEREKGNRLATRLRQVPLTRNLEPNQFRKVQALLALTGALVVLAPWLLWGAQPDYIRLGLAPLLLWLLPEGWLWLQVHRRRALLAQAYLDLLAHLATQTRAGAGSFQAFAGSPPVLREPLRGEVEELIADLGLAPLPAALQRFADRCDTPEIRSFAQHVIHQQALGIALQDVLTAEESHSLAMARQAMRRRIQATAITMASVTVILLLNGLLICLLPVFSDLAGFLRSP